MVDYIKNPFEKHTGANVLHSPRGLSFYIAGLLTLAWVIGNRGLPVGVILLVVPFAFFYLFMFFRHPQLGVYTIVFLGFILLGLHRYVPGIKGGVVMDSVIILTYIAVFFHNFYDKTSWKPAAKDITALAGIWALYAALGYFNPELISSDAYFATVRGISFYMLLIIPLTFMLINTSKRLEAFFYLWGAVSILATIKGLFQLYWKLDPWEQAWMDAGAYTNHLVFGKLRVFSFLSDAGQFGANQAYTGVVFMILYTGSKEKKQKIFYLITALLGFWGMFLSGTRGAITVPFGGFLLYSLVRKQFKITFSVLTFLVIAYVFFKFTTIGQNVDQIRRMRTAFDPNDKSFQLRLSNQRKLRVYLATRPFGGGIGHAGSKALPYMPYTFLANTATDSWYVMIWAEQGVVGLILHLFILFYIVIKGCYLVMVKIRAPMLKVQVTALVCGMLGVMVSSYGNAVLGAFPTGMLMYVSFVFITNPLALDTPEEEPVAGALPGSASILTEHSDQGILPE